MRYKSRGILIELALLQHIVIGCVAKNQLMSEITMIKMMQPEPERPLENKRTLALLINISERYVARMLPRNRNNGGIKPTARL